MWGGPKVVVRDPLNAGDHQDFHIFSPKLVPGCWCSRNSADRCFRWVQHSGCGHDFLDDVCTPHHQLISQMTPEHFKRAHPEASQVLSMAWRSWRCSAVHWTYLEMLWTLSWSCPNSVHSLASRLTQISWWHHLCAVAWSPRYRTEVCSIHSVFRAPKILDPHLVPTCLKG